VKLFDFIKSNAAPPPMMRAAAKGSLSVTPDEMIEILVFLIASPEFGTEARKTLAHWDEKSLLEVLSGGTASREVLDYFWAEASRHPRLLLALIENTAITERQLMALATVASREIVEAMLTCPRVRNSAHVLRAMEANGQLTPSELSDMVSPPAAEGSGPSPALDSDTEAAHQAWLQEHSVEIAAEAERAFQLADPDDSEKRLVTLAAVPATEAETFAAEIRAMPMPPEQRKLSALQKVTRMTVSERIKTAFGGDKEERSILIRDTSRVVQNAVLASPRLSDSEIEGFAANKTVQENVFRELARNRKFLKNYNVIRNLVNNPRCPLDIGLTLMKNLLVHDLYQLRFNKNVPDTLRKVAFKLHLEKKQATRK
jgi:hypothetical protein